MGKIVSGKLLLSKHVTKKDRVLLINPPVWETRYSWLRWNQPADLLKIGSYLRGHVGCSVELLDCMKPDKDDKVPEQWLPRDRRYRTVNGMRYPMRQFGLPHDAFRTWLAAKVTASPKKLPTQVWITSLCSYWFESVAEMVRLVRQSLKDVRLVLVGQYPRLLPEHASSSCAADLVVDTPVDLRDEQSAFDLYGVTPSFVAVGLNPSVAIAEIKKAVERQVYRVTFFADDLCRDKGEPFIDIVKATRGLHKHLRFHVICGLDPAGLTPEIAKLLNGKDFAEIHFEESIAGKSLNTDAYEQAKGYLVHAGVRFPDSRFSGFAWIGRPREDLEGIILRSFQIVDTFGGLILKPYSPSPGSPEHLANSAYLAKIPQQNWSPHFFPFSELNGITREEYHDLYRMAAFLNEKVRSHSFDFLKGTLGAEMLRDSLEREVWNLEPSPLSVID